MSKRLRGIFAAIATPVDEHGNIQLAAFTDLARSLLDGGCDGLNVLGTTGEATSFSLDQRAGLMRHVARSGLPLDRMMVGTGAAATHDAVQLTQLAGELGFAAALVLPPFYYKGITDDGVSRYFEAIVSNTQSNPIPLLLYNYPALSSVPYHIDLVRLLLARFGNRISGLKDSSGDIDYARKAAALSPSFCVFPSSEATLADAREGGPFAGCISATANLNADLCARALKQTDDAALKVAISIRQVFNGLPLIAGVKSLLAHIHSVPVFGNVVAPLDILDSVVAQRIAIEYDRLREHDVKLAG